MLVRTRPMRGPPPEAIAVLTCSSCGTENGPGARFCTECATPFAVPCPSCGTVTPPVAKFCSECATPLVPTARRAAAGPNGPATSGLKHAPLTGPEPGTERRLVSVLFADLVGFTALAEGRDAEDVRETLTRYFDLAGDV